MREKLEHAFKYPNRTDDRPRKNSKVENDSEPAKNSSACMKTVLNDNGEYLNGKKTDLINSRTSA